MEERYRYRENYQGPRVVPAETVAAELARIEEVGDLTARRVFEEARAEDATLHPMFEWDKEAAWYEHNLGISRRLIRAVVRVPEPVGGAAPIPTPVYIHVPDTSGKEGKYVRLELVIKDSAEFERALGEARRYLDSAESRFSELVEAAKGRTVPAEVKDRARKGFKEVRDALAEIK